MEFKQYPSYKPSGVEWLGDVPEHWNLKRFGYLFDENKKKNIGLKETNVLSLSYGNIKEKNIDDNKGLLPESFETYQIIEPNNIVFRFTDLQNDKRSLRSAISKYHGIITSAYIAVKTKQNADFYNYLFRAYDLQKVFYSMGEGMRQSLKMDELNKMPVVLPNKDEQKYIVSFLDTETARIDNLIAKQEKLIELLEEHRKSIISHAVTKGLNPNVPMKDSGVEWLGEVPEHWNILKSSYIFKVSKGKNAALLTKEYCATREQIYPVYSGQTENSGLMGMTDSYEYDCEENGGILSTTVGAKAMSVKYLDHKFNLSQNCMIIFSKNNDVYNNKFYYYFFQPLFHFYRNQIPDFMQPSFRMEDFYSYKIVSLTLDEQKKIVEYLDFENQKFDNLISKQQTLIEKLKEYRASIISHAVTGKIDVREFGA